MTYQLQREGRVKTGIKTPKGFPQNVDYFVCPPHVYEALGVKDRTTLKELPIYFTSNDKNLIFSVRKKKYNIAGGKSLLTCSAGVPREEVLSLNDETFVTKASRLSRDNQSWDLIDCDPSCPFRKATTNSRGDRVAPACKTIGALMFRIDGVTSTGCFEYDVKSNAVIKEVELVLDSLMTQFGRIEGIPLIMYTKKVGSAGKQGYVIGLKIDPRFAAATKARNPFLAAIERGESIDLQAPAPTIVMQESKASDEDFRKLWGLCQQTGRDKDALIEDVAKYFPGKANPRELSVTQIHQLIGLYEAELEAVEDEEDVAV